MKKTVIEIIEENDGSKLWYRNGQLHRNDGPAIEWASGDKLWYRNDKVHRDDGPAIEWADGSKQWRRNGKLHRDGGPAIEWADGRKAWYRAGQHVPAPEHSEPSFPAADFNAAALRKKIAELESRLERLEERENPAEESPRGPGAFKPCGGLPPP